MGLNSNGFWCKVWDIKDNGKFTTLKISTSKKVNDEYVKDFNGYVRAIGHAHNKAKEIKVGDSIHVTEFELTNNYVKERNITYTNVAVFEIDEIKGSNQPQQSQQETEWQKIDNVNQEQMPWE